MQSGTTADEAAARSRLLTVESYSVFLDLTHGGDSAWSRTEVRFRCREPGATTFANLDAAAVPEMILNGRRLDPKSLSLGRVPLTDLTAENTLVVSAWVHLSRSGSGLTQYTDHADGTSYVLANCFPTAAPTVFCCFDQPDLRAPITLIVTLPAGWTCISNGEVLHSPADRAAGVWRFATVVSMKPYEFTLCAGPYVTAPAAIDGGADGTQLSVHCRPALTGSPGLARTAGLVAAALRHYEQTLGVACPYRKLDIVFVPEFAVRAMQLPAVMYVSESLLQRAADPEDHFVGMILAHEVAHLWFGCLVEGRWWDDLWLAEALATYLSIGAVSQAQGADAAWAEFGMSSKASAYLADGLPRAQPVSSPVDSAADALTRPTAITYAKGASALRQLAALIGPDAMQAGLRDYLTSFGWLTTTLTDLIDCWSRASGRDLTGWAEQWLRQPGVNTLRPEMTVGPDGVITSFAVVEDPPQSDDGGPLRTHTLTIGLYEQGEAGLACRRRLAVTVDDHWTHVPELSGTPMPAAIILNDADLTFAAIKLDPGSWRTLVAAAMDTGDQLAESVCWNAAFHMVQSAELDAAEFAAIVARRMTTRRPVLGLDELLDRAGIVADFFTDAAGRAAARRQLAAAALTAAELAQPASRDQRILARGFAASANSPAQRDLLRFWLDGRSLPTGLVVDLELRAKILTTLAAHGQATDADLAAYAADDPVAGDAVRATCSARHPSTAAKQAAWAAALSAEHPPRLALAYARGFWVPGQEELLEGFRERYFAEALPALRRTARLERWTMQRLARALYPAPLADKATLAATDAELDRLAPDDALATVLLEQRTLLSRAMTARGASPSA
ncbi:MAG TPA: aminopeptidase N [Streptosporangiaceae bacterium]|nr:aminopeptidase N [Streptosporangiaceae bacterium]